MDVVSIFQDEPYLVVVYTVEKDKPPVLKFVYNFGECKELTIQRLGFGNTFLVKNFET